MIFFFRGRPSALFIYQTSLTWLSFASEPEEQKNIFEAGTGAISLSLSASSIAGSWLLAPNRWLKESLRICVAVTECGAPQPRHALDIGLALAVVDEHSLPTLDDQRTRCAQRREVGVGVNQGFEVADGEIAKRRHGFAFGYGFAFG